jgi:phosphoribosylpyrophosphate synthetase
LHFECFNYYSYSKIPDYRNAIIVARNPGQAKRVTAIAERLRLGIAVIHGCETDKDAELADNTENTNSSNTLKSKIRKSIIYFN